MKAFVSWSGGKDTSLSCYKAMQAGDVEVSRLLNMATEDGNRSRTHGISSDLLKLQAEAIGIPITQRKATWQTYEAEFKEAVADLKKDGIEAGVFGDIDLQDHRDWVERVCRESGIKPFFPLWHEDRMDVLNNFIDYGFKAVVVTAKADVLGSEWIGRNIDKSFIADLSALENVDLCGEKGEYHTFVFSGPIFSKEIKILRSKKTGRDNYWFLDIINYEKTDKT